MHNPVRFVDPTGLFAQDLLDMALGGTDGAGVWLANPIVFALDATDVQMAAFNEAFEYLMQSETFRSLWDTLQRGGRSINLNFISNHEMRATYHLQTHALSIYWNPTSGMVVGQTQSRSMQVQSAAIGLAHEMGHIVQFLEGLHHTMPSSMQREADVLARFENPIARELGEPRRVLYGHTAGAVITGGPTEWGTVTMPRRNWIFTSGRTWDTHGTFTNSNTWRPN